MQSIATSSSGYRNHRMVPVVTFCLYPGQAQTTCKPQKEALDRCIASQKLEEKRRREAEGNVLLEEDALPKSSRGERVSNSADTSTR